MPGRHFEGAQRVQRRKRILHEIFSTISRENILCHDCLWASPCKISEERRMRMTQASKRDSSMRKTPILRCILSSLSALDQKQKDREIERMIASLGGRITDELERR